MKVFCLTATRNAKILQMENTLQSLGLEYAMAYVDPYENTHPYLQKKLVETFFPRLTRSCDSKHYRSAIAKAKEYSPDIILGINFGFDQWAMAELNPSIKKITWFIDSIVGINCDATLRHATNFTYDRASAAYLLAHGVNANYCPVGYNDAYTYSYAPHEKTLDVVFVGAPYKRRLVILETVAKAAQENNWRFKVYGPFFRPFHFWKEWQSRHRYPHLFSYMVNGSLSPQEIATIYAQTQICLNIHDEKNKGVNPRTFEIMATGSIELLDAREDYDIIHPGEDVVVFHDDTEAVEKIAYYLAHAEEREKIAQRGKERIWERRSMKACLRQVLGLAQEER
ncbi:MAG: glycosyltransferase [Selenomonadaceae bacterium]|nr:glycosyltransferase [Selenomonadaceae bacterium]